MPEVLPFRKKLFSPGQRVAVAVSGGADSVALLRALLAQRDALGLVISAVHVHHALRGEEADCDRQFVEELAATHGIRVWLFHGDAAERAARERETLEEAARGLRYGFFRDLLSSGDVDVVATAHTLDDQAETVLMKLLRGAWTEGLGGIHPVVACKAGRIVRPLLAVGRAEVERYLAALGQPWREDSSNADLGFTRNRVRHALLPLLREYNPQISRQMARLSAVARDEEAWWEAELAKVLPSLLLPGRATRGGGRATSTHPEEDSLGIELERLRGMHPALRRRVLRAAARQLGGSLPFDGVEELLGLTGLASAEAAGGSAGEARRRTLMLHGGLRAERTPRELRLCFGAGRQAPCSDQQAAGAPEAGPPVYALSVPGEVAAVAYGLAVKAQMAEVKGKEEGIRVLAVRAWEPGDRVTLRYSRGPRKAAEVLDRLRLYGVARHGWPVIAAGRTVLWIRGAEVDPAALAAAGVRLEVFETEGYPRPEPPPGRNALP